MGAGVRVLDGVGSVVAWLCVEQMTRHVPASVAFCALEALKIHSPDVVVTVNAQNGLLKVDNILCMLHCK